MGQKLMQADVSGLKSALEIRSTLEHYARANQLPKGSWIVGFGWDQNEFNGGDFPHAVSQFY